VSRKLFVPFVVLFAFILALTAITPGTSAQGQTLFINEILVGNASTTLDTDYYNYSGWIEIYNAGSSSVNLKNYALAYWDYEADSPIVWKVPVAVSVPAKGTVIFWADEHNKNRHAGFEMDMRGDRLELRNPSGTVLDWVEYDMRINGSNNFLLPDISYGRQADGSGTWAYFDRPTPAASNTTPSHTAPNLADGPTFSPAGGYYTGGQSVTLSTAEPGGQIRYTTNGAIPTASSNLYTGPINVNSPTVIRARVFANGKQVSKTITHTYLINVSRNLPVVSLATHPDHLFDNTIGIYVAGTNGIAGKCSTAKVNWNQKWERPASMEMYETDGSRIVAQDIGFEIFGNCSRTRAQKSLEIKARRTYGDNDIDYMLFDDKPHLDSYKRLVLRNGGTSQSVMFRDAIQHYIVKDMMDIDYQSSRPVIVLLNGQYWGIYNLREKADEAYPEQNYDLDADTDFDFIDKNTADAGNLNAWNSLQTYISQNNLSVATHYNYVKSQVDIEEFMNYFIVEIYGNNTDWLSNNIRFWRAYDGGKWRWVLLDLDASLGSYAINNNYLAHIIGNVDPKQSQQSLLFRKLMQNTEFRNDFVQRFASHINITYEPSRTELFLAEFQAQIQAEMPAHIARWGAPNSMSYWNDVLDSIIRNFYAKRPAAMRSHLNQYLGSPGTANLTVNITGGGDVMAAGVVVPASGYSGPYFRNIPITLTAVPRAGWAFVKWQETNSTDPTTTVTLSGNTTRTAVFEEVGLPNIVITELHYNPPQGNDHEFIELYNAGTSAVNLTNFAITSGIVFTFPTNETIAAGEYIVLANNAATYAGQGYRVFGWTSGNLSNGGETVTLSDGANNTISTVTYSDSAPWPTTPDGNGPSLSLISPSADLSDPANWFASLADGGSPGQANPTAPPEPGSITIAQQLVGDAPAADWQYTGGLGAFSLPAAGGQQTFSNLSPGSFQVAQTAVGGYATAVSCSNGAGGSSSVTVNLTSGANVICTFTNTKTTTPPPTACDTPPDGSLLTNFGFEDSKTKWSFYTNGKASYNVVSSNTPHCDNYARIGITTSGSNVQLFQTGFTLEPNTEYTLRLTARATGGKNVQVLIHRNTTPTTNYGLSRTLNLTAEWQTFEVAFQTSGFSSTTTDTRLRLWLAPYDVNGAVFDFDEVVLMKK